MVDNNNIEGVIDMKNKKDKELEIKKKFAKVLADIHKKNTGKLVKVKIK